MLDQPVRSVTVRALPDALPESIEYDVSALEAGATLLVGDLAAPEGVEIVDDPDGPDRLGHPALGRSRRRRIEAEEAAVEGEEGRRPGRARGRRRRAEE